ncbi:hypothetical protein LguiA_034671 [Lonicera macranthoides]
MRLQFLENELGTMTQGNASISEYFLKVKNLCSEISGLDTEEPINDARLRRYLIRGLRNEFMPFISSVQGWANQPTIIDLENLLSNQEALVKQMSSASSKSLSQVDDVLYTNDRRKMNFSSKNSSDNKQSRNEGESGGDSKTCFRCGKTRHFKRNCRVKIVCNRCGNSCHIKRRNCRVKLKKKDANTAHENNESEQANWEQCFSIVAVDQSENVTSTMHQTDTHTNGNVHIDYNKEWILDSSCSHHATRNSSLLSDVRAHYGKRAIVTAGNSLHPVAKEGNFNVKARTSSDEGASLDAVYHVPGLKKNLASVSQLADSGRYVLFGPDNVKILSNLKFIVADVLLTGKRKESLHVLSASEAYIEKTGQNANASIWHARLRHIGYQLLQKISRKGLLDGVPLFKEIRQGVVCPGCQYGKSHRLPFLKS